MLLEETPAVLSLGKLCEDHGYTNHWTSGQKPHLIRNDRKIDCKISNFVPFVVPGLSTSSSSPASSSTPSPSSSQESISANRENRYLENPVSERSRGTNGKLLVKPAARIHRNNWRITRSTKRCIALMCLIGYRNSEKFWLMKVLQQSLGETQSKEVKTLPSHLMNFQWSREQKWNRVRVSTVYIRTFRRTQIVISA